MIDPSLLSTATDFLTTDKHIRQTKFKWRHDVYWLKKAAKPKQLSPLRRWMQNKAAQVFDIPLLRFTTRAGAAADLMQEKKRMEEWQRAGFLTPDILASGDHWFLTREAGIQLAKTMGGSNDRQTLTDALRNLQTAHNRNMCHGKPMLRDMLLSPEGRIVILDLEETPDTVMPMADAQARDILLFLISIPYVVSDDIVVDIASMAITGASGAARQSLARAISLSRPLIPLLAFLALLMPPKKARKLGHTLRLSRILVNILCN